VLNTFFYFKQSRSQRLKGNGRQTTDNIFFIMQGFRNLGLDEDLIASVEALGFENPTPVQELVIPAALASDNDIIALAQTGTGKTAAFGLPLLQLIDPSKRYVQALVLCPTRELCIQVTSDIAKYASQKHTAKVTPVYGGASIDTQIRQIKSGTHIVVATPGRLVDLINRGAIVLETIERVVLDEADEMLNMGFKDDLDIILGAASLKKSTWLFSATMSGEIRAIARNYMNSPTELTTGRKNETNTDIEHVYYVCRPDDRYSTLKRIVDAQPEIFGLIFCRTKAETKEVADMMTRDGYNSDALYGDLSQNDRDRVMNRFREGALQLLIATDVAARGLDVSDITHVINYGLPDDNEVYTHRSGRTGRAGKKGVSITITTPKFEDRIRQIERASKAQFAKLPIPSGSDVCGKQLFNIIHKVHNAEVQHEEIEPFLAGIYAELEDLSKEEVIKRFASLEFNRFLTYYKDAPDLNIRPRKPFDSSRGDAQPVYNSAVGGMTRLFINLGEMDGITKGDFIRMLGQNFNIPGTAVGRIDISKSYMHFDVASQYTDILKREMHNSTYDGRPIRLDSASERSGGERSGGGFRGGSSDRPFERRGGGGGGDRRPYGGGGDRGGDRRSGGGGGDRSFNNRYGSDKKKTKSPFTV
jgi:ATP-dependent RNA helicase DeaD